MASAAVVGRRLYVIAGGEAPGLSVSGIVEVFEADLTPFIPTVVLDEIYFTSWRSTKGRMPPWW